MLDIQEPKKRTNTKLFTQKPTGQKRYKVLSPNGMPQAELWAGSEKEALISARQTFGPTASVKAA